MKLDFTNSLGLSREEINKFNIFFSQKSTREIMEELDFYSKQKIKRIIYAITLYLLIIIGLFIYGSNLGFDGYIILFLCIVIPFVISGKNSFKNNVLLNNFLKHMFGNNISFANDKNNFSESYLDLSNKTGFFNKNERYLSSEDSIKYSYKINDSDSINLEGIEIKTRVNTYNNKKSNGKTKSYYIFKLTFLNPRFNIDNPIKFKKGSNFDLGINRVNLENQNFEKLFNVYSKDELTTRQLLNPLIMQNIVDYVNNIYSKNGNINLEMFVFKNEFYIKFDTYKGFLDFSNFNINKLDYISFYTEIKNIINFTYKINLIYFDKNYFNKH